MIAQHPPSDKYSDRPPSWIRGDRDWTLAVLAFLLVAYPAAHWVQVNGFRPAASLNATVTTLPVTPPTEKTADYFVALSGRQYSAGQFQACIDSSREALKLTPGLAEAFNNIGLCYASLGLLDEAIRNESEAVLIKPDYQLAKNNLAWALQQKQAQSAHAKK